MLENPLSLNGPVVIAGGARFLGISLAAHLHDLGVPVVLLSRSRPKVSGPWTHELWDGRTLGDWRRVLDGAAGLVNLAGRSVDCIKTPDHQDEILRSRVELPIGLPAFAWMVRLGARWLLRTDPELALYGRYVVPKRLVEEGFEFKYPTLPAALAEVLSSHASR